MNNKVFCIIPILMTTSYALIRINNQECENDMKFFLDTILPIIITAVLSGAITYFVSSKLAKKSQIIKNTEEIQKLARQLGVNDKETFHSEFTKQYDNILKEVQDNIGKTPNDKALTGQHNDIMKIIERDFEKIHSRYEKEDASYRQFTAQQLDIKEALDNFSKDYTNVISLNKRLYSENIRLKEENSILIKRNRELKTRLEKYAAPTKNQSLHL